MSADLADLSKRVANLVRVGRIKEVDHANVRVRVDFGTNNTTRWIPWMTHRAGSTRNWNPPAVGEQVAFLCPSGELGAAFVLPGGINWNDKAAPGNSGDVVSQVSPDGANVSYNSASHEHAHTIPAGGKHTLTLGAAKVEVTNSNIKLTLGGSTLDVSAGGIAITGNVTVTGSITSTGDQIAGTISQQNHKHVGVTPGPGVTGLPV